MRRYCAAWVLLVAAVLLPVFAVYAADTALPPQTEAAPAQPAPAPVAKEVTPAVTVAESRSASLKLNLDAMAALPRSDDFRIDPAIGAASASSRAADSLYGFPVGAPGGTGLNLTPAPYAVKPGWEMSGRVGPLRFLSPLDGERETQLRLGGRVPGQPRMPGMGLFNLGIHYNFE